MTNSAGMLIGYGVIKDKYLSIPQNFRLNNIHLDNSNIAWKLRGIQISAGNAVSFVALTNIEMTRASLELHNKPQHIFMRNIKVMQESTAGPALTMNFDLRKDVRGVFMAKNETLLSLVNVHAVNEKDKVQSISTGLITMSLMWKILTLSCRNGAGRFATIPGKIEPYLGITLLQS